MSCNSSPPSLAHSNDAALFVCSALMDALDSDGSADVLYLRRIVRVLVGVHASHLRQVLQHTPDHLMFPSSD